MKSTGRVCSPARAGFFALALFAAFGLGAARAQNEPILVPDAVDYQKLLAILPEPPSGWSADKPEGSTEDVGGFKITNVHRDYHKGEGEKAPSAAISILDSVSNPDYVSATTEAWKSNSDTSEGYAKSVRSMAIPDSKHSKKTPSTLLCGSWSPIVISSRWSCKTRIPANYKSGSNALISKN